MSHASDLIGRFQSRRAVVGVIGLGYVGLPLSCTIVEAGLRVVGFDVDPEKPRLLSLGKSYLRHIPPERIAQIVVADTTPEEVVARSGQPGMAATTDFAKLTLCDAILICVPTPLTEGREPDLSYVRGTAETIAAHLRPGQLVVLESTTYPGTTDEVVKPILEAGGLQVGRDFHLAYSPEREDPGNQKFDTRTTPKIVGGVTPECGEVAKELYSSFIERVVPVADARVAEAAKLLENIYRSVNIALVNELKLVFERMGIDVWDVIDAAATKPFGFTPFYPGPGLGGHCIPIDPFYLTWKARHHDFATRFIELAGEINTSMPYRVVDRIVEGLGRQGKPLPGSRVLVLGMAYKKDIDDLRESPSLRVLELLQERGAVVSYNDPYVPTLRGHHFRHYGFFDLDSAPIDDDALAELDCVVITTDHSVYEADRIVRASRLVVDTRNATRNVTEGREKIFKA